MAAASARSAADAVRVIFLGPPGAGKGTQATRLAAYLGVPKISTGDMLREAIALGTAVGREAGPLMEKGNLAPDVLALQLVGERVRQADCSGGFVLDGFPRTVVQAQGLDQMPDMDSRGWVVFDFQVPRQVLMSRLSGRRWCPVCQATYHVANDPPRTDGVCDRDGVALVQRDDDREAVVAERLRQYEARTRPVVDHYRGRARLVRVDGDRPVGEVLAGLVAAVEVPA